MDPNDQIAASKAKMEAAAKARRARPRAQMVCTTTTEAGNKGPSTASGGPLSGGMTNSGPLGRSTLSAGAGFGGGASAGSATGDKAAPANSEEQVRQQLQRVGIEPTVDLTGKDQPEQPLRLDLKDTRSFLGQAPPQVGMIQCYIVRDKPYYRMFLEEGNQFLLSAMKRGKNKTSNYTISLDSSDLERASGHFYGKLRANFVGTEFTIYDKGEKPVAGGQGEDGAMAIRQELGAIAYDKNILGTKGPRKMTVLIPEVDEKGRRVPFRPTSEAETLLYGYKSQEARGVKPKDMVVLRNKEPSWNPQLRAYVLNFNGRVTKASVKNFQLVDEREPNKVLLQFGKVDADKFAIDFQYPICGLQAFGVALSAFDSKLVCE